MLNLEARFMNKLRSNQRGFAQLNFIVTVPAVGSAFRKCEWIVVGDLILTRTRVVVVVNVQRVVFRYRVLRTRIESAVHIRARIGLPEYGSIGYICVDGTGILVLVVAGAEIHRQFVLDDR